MRMQLSNFKLNIRYIKQLDIIIILTLICLCLFGVVNIYSATHLNYNYYYLKKQIICILLGIVAMYIILTIDYKIITGYAGVFYWIGIASLIFTKLAGVTVNGARCWIKVGSMLIEPGEFVKIAVVLFLAKKIFDMNAEINNVKNLFVLLIYTAIPLGIMMTQPDLGMILISCSGVLGILFIAKLDLRVMMCGLIGMIILAAVAWNSGVLHDYQKDRITSFMYQDQDPYGKGYQLTESKTAIGSGGIWGQGLFKGIQTSVGAIPESSTDFIFTAVGEEWGFIGSLLLLGLYGILLARIIITAKYSEDVRGNLICIGISCCIMFSVFQNIGMTIGIMPITGITLPFISYGGSSILTNFIQIGLVLNVSMRKKKYIF